MLWLIIKKYPQHQLPYLKTPQRATNKQQNNVPKMLMLVNYYRMNRLHKKKA